MSEFLNFLKDIIITSINTSGIGMTILFLLVILLILALFIGGKYIIPFIIKKFFKKDNNDNILESIKELCNRINLSLMDFINKIMSSLSIHNYSKLVKILLGINDNYIGCLKNVINNYTESGAPNNQFFKVENCIRNYLDNLVIDSIKDFIFNDSQFLEEVKKELYPITEDFIINLQSNIKKNKNNENMKFEIEILLDSYLKDLEEILMEIYQKIIIKDENIKFIKPND